jgi:4-hydroxy-tetrahydrodipicolinate reductase
MGRSLLEALGSSTDLRLHAALERSDCPVLGRDAGEFMGFSFGVTITDHADAALAGSDVLIDFTRPDATLYYLKLCTQQRVKMVIGTTGLTPEHKTLIQNASQHIAIVCTPNMSVGVNLVLKLLEVAAPVLRDDYDVEIVEAHHRHKVDAPSGTALRMGETIAKAQGRELAQAAVYSRHGNVGERPQASIGFATVRGGDIVGDHTVLFAGTGERIEMTHRVSSRATFALGALRAARFLAGRPSGLYDMQDVLNLR